VTDIGLVTIRATPAAWKRSRSFVTAAVASIVFSLITGNGHITAPVITRAPEPEEISIHIFRVILSRLYRSRLFKSGKKKTSESFESFPWWI
jgi:hypothetical protein